MILDFPWINFATQFVIGMLKSGKMKFQYSGINAKNNIDEHACILSLMYRFISDQEKETYLLYLIFVWT